MKDITWLLKQPRTWFGTGTWLQDRFTEMVIILSDVYGQGSNEYIGKIETGPNIFIRWIKKKLRHKLNITFIQQMKPTLISNTVSKKKMGHMCTSMTKVISSETKRVKRYA